MSDDHSEQMKRSAAPGPDERDATIERLEHELDEERQKSATLRENVDGLRFQLEVLEKSYAKQLADARSGSAPHRELVEQQAKLAAFRDETMQLLAQAQSVIEGLTAERDELSRQLGQPGGAHWRPPRGAAGDAASADGTINELMANPIWARDQPRTGDSNLQAQVRAEPDAAASEEMIAADLVFTAEDGKDDADPSR